MNDVTSYHVNRSMISRDRLFKHFDSSGLIKERPAGIASFIISLIFVTSQCTANLIHINGQKVDQANFKTIA